MFKYLLLSATCLTAQTPTVVFIFSGQSNMSAYGQRGQLNPVPTWAQTAANGWEGHPVISSDTPNTQYDHPTLANFPMLYVDSGNSGIMWNGWGAYEGSTPRYSDGTIIEVGSYGPELAFLWEHKSAHATIPLAGIKDAVGGTSIIDWLSPAH